MAEVFTGNLCSPYPWVRYDCLVDGCSWYLDEHRAQMSGALLPAPTTREAVETTVQEMRRAIVKHIDDQIRAHLETHTVVEWASTISRLRRRVGELEHDASEAAHG